MLSELLSSGTLKADYFIILTAHLLHFSSSYVSRAPSLIFHLLLQHDWSLTYVVFRCRCAGVSTRLSVVSAPPESPNRITKTMTCLGNRIWVLEQILVCTQFQEREEKAKGKNR